MIVPAKKLPEASLSTIVENVLAEVALVTSINLESLPAAAVVDVIPKVTPSESAVNVTVPTEPAVPVWETISKSVPVLPVNAI